MAQWGISRITLVLIVAAVGGGCGGHKIVQPDHGPLKKIALIPVHSPPGFAAENENYFVRFASSLAGSLAMLALQLESREKTKKFAERMRSEQSMMGQKMTRALLEELPKFGYQVELVEGLNRADDEPDDVDYQKLHVEGAVLHVWYEDVAMYSPWTRIDYVPRVNVSVRLIYPLDEESLYDETLRYGADARGEKYWSIPGEPKYRITSFDELLNHPDQVVESFDAGIQAIAQHIGKEFRRAVK